MSNANDEMDLLVGVILQEVDHRLSDPIPEAVRNDPVLRVMIANCIKGYLNHILCLVPMGTMSNQAVSNVEQARATNSACYCTQPTTSRQRHTT